MIEGGEVGAGLRGARIAITRPPDRAAPLAALLASAGAELAAYPLIQIESPAERGEPGAGTAPLTTYNWVVVTSAHAAAALLGLRGAAPWPKAVHVAAVGAATAHALARAGIPVDLTPPRADATALAEALIAAAAPPFGGSLRGRRILFPRSDRAARELPEQLKAAGAMVDEIEAYRTVLDLERARELRLALGRGELAALIVTSPSSVEALAQEAAGAWPAVLAGIPVVAIGPATAAELSRRGRPAEAVAAAPDPAGLLEALRAAVGYHA